MASKQSSNDITNFLSGNSLLKNSKLGSNKLQKELSSNNISYPNGLQLNLSSKEFIEDFPKNKLSETPKKLNTQPQIFKDKPTGTNPNIRYQKNPRNFNKLPSSPNSQTAGIQYTAQRGNPEGNQMDKYSTASKKGVGNDVVFKLVNQAANFDAARRESEQCLSNLFNRIQNQISNINDKLDRFETKMTSILNQQFEKLRIEVFKIVQEVFRLSKDNISSCVKKQQQCLAAEMYTLREMFEKELITVEKLRVQIKGKNWRKAAGELISSDIQERVERLIQKNSKMEVKKWQIGNLAGDRKPKLEKLLKDIVMITV